MNVFSNLKIVLLSAFIWFMIPSIYAQTEVDMCTTNSITICKGESIKLTCSTLINGEPCVNGAYEWEWCVNPGFFHFSPDYETSGPKVFTPTENTTYEMEIVTPGGFFSSDEVHVSTTVEVVVKSATDVNFSQHATKKYGWDDWENFGNIRNSGTVSNTEVPIQSIEIGETVKVKVKIETDPNIFDCVYFKSSNPGIVTVSPNEATANEMEITLTGVSKGEAEIRAVTVDASGNLIQDAPTPTILKVIVMNKLNQKLKIVVVNQQDIMPVGGSNYTSTSPFSGGTQTMTQAAFLSNLNNIYKGAMVNWTLDFENCSCHFDLNRDGKVNVTAQVPWATTEMQSIITNCENDPMNIYDKIVFCVDNSNDYSAGYGDATGGKYTFHHQSEVTNGSYPMLDPSENIAHELGHTYNLEHTNTTLCPANSSVLYEDKLNVMGYCINSQNFNFRLRYFQWEIINP